MTKREIYPAALLFDSEIVSDDFRGVVERIVHQASSVGFPQVTGWQTEREQDGPPAKLTDQIQRLPENSGEPRFDGSFIHVNFADGSFASAKFSPEWNGVGLIQLGLRAASDHDGKIGLLAIQSRWIALLKLIFLEFRVYSAELLAIGGGALCIPDVPLITTSSHIAVTNEPEVTDLYDDPAAFWNAGWTIAAEHDGQRLLTRAVDLLAGPEYLEQIIEHQWAMARAAKAGETGYSDPEVLPEEEAVFRAGAARLEYVGYSADEKLIEYSCVIGEGQHIQGWEVFALRSIVATGRTPDGKAAVETVRIVFLEKWMARSEKRPLLDVGCKVFFYAADGELHEIAE